MAENKLFDTGIKVTNGFSAAGAFPVDKKSIVETIAERDDHVTQNRAYEGMKVYVKADKKNYQYINSQWVDEEARVSALEQENDDLKKRLETLETEEFASTDDIDAMFPDKE